MGHLHHCRGLLSALGDLRETLPRSLVRGYNQVLRKACRACLQALQQSYEPPGTEDEAEQEE